MGKPEWEYHDSVAFMTAEKMVESRTANEKYGPPLAVAERAANVWSGILGHRINPELVPILLAAYNMIRLGNDPLDGKRLADVAGQLRMLEVIQQEKRRA